MAKGLVSTKMSRGNYGTPVSYTRQSPYQPKRQRATSKSSVK